MTERRSKHFGTISMAVVLTMLVLQPCFAVETSREQLLAFVSPLVKNGYVDGVSVGIRHREQTWTLHCGTTGSSGEAPADDTIYEIGSISKVFTGLLLADAVTHRGLTLDQPAHVDGIAELPRWKDQRIRWIDLATHRSGLPRLANNMKGLQSDDPYARYDSTRASQFLAGYELTQAPGAKVQYSNFGASWLGFMLSKHRQQDYAGLLRTVIAEPMGMQDTVIGLTPSQEERFATGHRLVGEPTSPWHFADMPGAGGIRSTTADMLRFIDFTLDPPSNALGESIELAWKQHSDAEPPHFAMGLGWMIARDGATRWHNGQTGGFHSAVFVNRGLRTGVVVLANTGPAPQVDEVAQAIVQHLAGMPTKPMEVRRVVDVDSETMHRLEGQYQLAKNFVFDVRVDGDRLMVGVTNQPTHQVFSKSQTRWYYKVVDAELDFDLAETGPAASVTLFQNGVRQTAKRID
ncbi:MAG: serine hydrolase [Planctomycetota bacterium]